VITSHLLPGGAGHRTAILSCADDVIAVIGLPEGQWSRPLAEANPGASIRAATSCSSFFGCSISGEKTISRGPAFNESWAYCNTCKTVKKPAIGRRRLKIPRGRKLAQNTIEYAADSTPRKFRRSGIIRLVSNVIPSFGHALLTELGMEYKIAMRIYNAINVVQTYVFNLRWAFRRGGIVTDYFLRRIHAYGYSAQCEYTRSNPAP